MTATTPTLLPVGRTAQQEGQVFVAITIIVHVGGGITCHSNYETKCNEQRLSWAVKIIQNSYHNHLKSSNILSVDQNMKKH